MASGCKDVRSLFWGTVFYYRISLKDDNLGYFEIKQPRIIESIRVRTPRNFCSQYRGTEVFFRIARGPILDYIYLDLQTTTSSDSRVILEENNNSLPRKDPLKLNAWRGRPISPRVDPALPVEFCYNQDIEMRSRKH